MKRRNKLPKQLFVTVKGLDYSPNLFHWEQEVSHMEYKYPSYEQAASARNYSDWWDDIVERIFDDIHKAGTPSWWEQLAKKQEGKL